MTYHNAVRGGHATCTKIGEFGRAAFELCDIGLQANSHTYHNSSQPSRGRAVKNCDKYDRGPVMWPWRCGLMARPVSGVEWSGTAVPVI